MSSKAELLSNFVNQREQKGRTALYMGVESARPKCVETLLEYKANPEIADNDGVTPLYLACTKGLYDCIKPLLASGAKPVYPEGKTDLITLVFQKVSNENKLNAVYDLLSNGAVVEESVLNALVDKLSGKEKTDMQEKIEAAREARSKKLTSALAAEAPLPTGGDGVKSSPMDIISAYTGFDIPLQ